MPSPIKPGQRFGRWTVVSLLPERYYGQMLWQCVCDCGTTRAVPSHSLVAGRSLSCGCLARDHIRANAADLTGQRFGRLTVLHMVGSKSRWLCRCDCGNMISVHRRQLLGGNTRSCGCIRKERASAMAKEREQGRIAHEQEHVEGTYISSIAPARKTNRNSSTGVKGVSRLPDGHYRAYINLRYRQYHIGLYPTLEEAAQAREDAEKELYSPIIDRFDQTKRR